MEYKQNRQLQVGSLNFALLLMQNDRSDYLLIKQMRNAHLGKYLKYIRKNSKNHLKFTHHPERDSSLIFW